MLWNPVLLIVSDSWSSYNKISQLKDYEHLTVNHNFQVLDNLTGAQTNKMEGMWLQAEKKVQSYEWLLPN